MSDRSRPACPICGDPIPARSEPPPPLPFCSPRCQAVDLHNWLGGVYQPPTLLDEEELEELG